MKCISHLLALGISLVSVVAGFAGGQGTFMTHFGELQVGEVTVAADQAARQVKVAFEKEGLTNGNTAKDWELGEGWFAFVDEDRRHVWVYNGNDAVLLSERAPGEKGLQVTIHGDNQFPVAVPAAVLKRLKQPLQRKLSVQTVGGGTLVSAFGQYEVGDFTVKADRATRRLGVTRTVEEEPGRIVTDGSAPDKELMDGWFAFVDGNGKHVWMYDGADMLLLMEWSSKDFGTTYLDPRRARKGFRVPVPDVVLERLEN